jgi:DNA primase
VSESVPFVAFQVDRILAGADSRSAEGRDRAASQLRPLLAQLPPSVLRDEITRKVAERLELSQARLADLLAAAPSAGNGSSPRAAVPEAAPAAGSAGRANPARPVAMEPSERRERDFLVQCVASPQAGAAALQGVDIDELIRSDRMRRAAWHLRDHADAPMADLPPEDESLARTIAHLVQRAARDEVSPNHLKHAQLVLEGMRLERAIRVARLEGRPGIGDLARERERVMGEIHAIVTKLEATV